MFEKARFISESMSKEAASLLLKSLENDDDIYDEFYDILVETLERRTKDI